MTTRISAERDGAPESDDVRRQCEYHAMYCVMPFPKASISKSRFPRRDNDDEEDEERYEQQLSMVCPRSSSSRALPTYHTFLAISTAEALGLSGAREPAVYVFILCVFLPFLSLSLHVSDWFYTFVCNA